MMNETDQPPFARNPVEESPRRRLSRVEQRPFCPNVKGLLLLAREHAFADPPDTEPTFQARKEVSSMMVDCTIS